MSLSIIITSPCAENSNFHWCLNSQFFMLSVRVFKMMPLTGSRAAGVSGSGSGSGGISSLAPMPRESNIVVQGSSEGGLVGSPGRTVDRIDNDDL